MASRLRIACGLSVAVLSVAGCVSMPSSGPPTSLSVKQADTGQSQNYVGLYAQPPQPGWSAELVVEGFLFASASYYTAGDVVRQYLTPQTRQAWSPGSVTVIGPFHVSQALSATGSGNQQAVVSVHGQVLAALNDSGQQLYASAAQGSGTDAQPSSSSSASGSVSCPGSPGKPCSYPFTLDRVDGQWRIANAPAYLLLDERSFNRTWEPQDLYFFDTAKHVLVPDSVFVPIGTDETDLLNRLAQALKSGPASWLANATVNVFPADVKSVSVSVAQPSAAVVNLTGTLTPADRRSLQYIAAELVWTLTAASANGGPPITGVQLEVNGIPWTNAPENRGSASAYDPYPSADASFTFVKDGVPQSLCGSAKNSSTGTPVPIFGHPANGAVTTCGQSPASSPPSSSSANPTTSASTTATQRPGSDKHGHPASTGGKTPTGKTPATTASANTVSMVAVSPDGKYVAEVSSNGDQLIMGRLGAHAALKPVSGPGTDITSISWDRQDDLWLTQGQNGNIWLVPQPQQGKPIELTFPGDVTALAIAPDGVRLAMIVQGSSGSQILLASINPNGLQTGQPSAHGNQAGNQYIGTPQVPLGPGITDAMALTWYDADHLIVLTRSAGSAELQEVPVDGRAATQSLATPQGVTVSSIAAGNTANFVVAGLSNGRLEVSGGFDGPWQPAGYGSAPAYIIPPASGS